MLERFSRFSFAISEIYRCWHKLAAEELAKYGLSSAHTIYLNTLYNSPEGITAAKLGELSGKDKADVSRMVAILEKKGMLEKQAVGGNMYRALLKLTEQGREAARHVQERAAVAVELAGAGLSESDRKIFYYALEQITNNLQVLCKEGLPENGKRDSL